MLPLVVKPVEKTMEKKDILSNLENLLLSQFDIRVVYENLLSQSIRRKRGLCRFDDEYLFIINEKEKTDYKIAAICEILTNFDLESVYLPPQVRKVIDKNRKTG